MEDREAGQPVVVRWAKEEEWAPAMQMVWRTFLKFEGRDYTEEGIKNFFDFICFPFLRIFSHIYSIISYISIFCCYRN